MPIRFILDPKHELLLLTTAEGLVTFEEILKHIDMEAGEILLRHRELFDARTATTNLTADQVRQIVARLHTVMHSGLFGPVAVVTTDDVFFGMARMMGMFSEARNGPQVAAFRTYDEALDWLVNTSPQ